MGRAQSLEWCVIKVPCVSNTEDFGPEVSVVSNSEKVVTIGLSGGLGNQLFQYAAARSLALKNNCDLVLDTGFFDSRRHRRFELQCFPIRARLVGKPDQARWQRLIQSMLHSLTAKSSEPVYSEPHMHFDSAWKTLAAPITLKGYFQSPKYFEEHAKVIRSELTPSEPNDAESLRMERILAEPESVSIHVRRGDYISNPSAKQIYCECTPEYYRTALAHLPGTGPVVFFSDDIAWTKSNLVIPGRDCFWVGENGTRSGVSDMWLMSKANHHIIANSTFSWWGAWLSLRDDGMTVAPKAWFRDSNIRCVDLIPGDWVRQ